MKKKVDVGVIITILFFLAVTVSGVIFVPKFFNKKVVIPEKQKIVYLDPQDVGLMGNREVTYEEDGDEDGDGLTNGEEKKNHTNMLLADTDGDGLTDYEELMQYETDPSNPDSDGDTITDGNEIRAGLDPLNEKSDGKTADKKVDFTYSFSHENMTLVSEGNAMVYDADVSLSPLTGVSQQPGVMSELYDVHVPEDSKGDTTITFHYDNMRGNHDASDIFIYQYTNDQKWEKVDCKQNEEDMTVTATITTSARYAICDKERLNKEAVPQALLLIDNSGSMYPDELCPGSDENDVDFKRLAMAENLIQLANGDILFGLAKYTGTYTLMAPLESSDQEMYNAINRIRTEDEVFDGTAIETSLMNAIGEFAEDDDLHRNFVVMLTDGISTEGGWLWGSAYSQQDIINAAKNKSIVIITIGLGNNVNTDFLRGVAEGTGGIYIHASNDDAVEQAYNAIMTVINNNLVDSDEDGTMDEVIVSNAQFTVPSNSFPYPNIYLKGTDGSLLEGQCYGFATLAYKYYTGTLQSYMGASSEMTYGYLGSSTVQADGYDLTGSFFFDEYGNITRNSLGDYDNTTLDLYAEIRAIDVEERYTLNQKGLYFTDEVKNMISQSPLLKYDHFEFGEHKTQNGWVYTSADVVYVDIYNVSAEALSEQEYEDYRFLCALYRIFVSQLENDHETVNLIVNNLSYNYQDQGFERMTEQLKSGKPVVVSAADHTVLCTRVVQSLEDENIYNMYVYDCNTPETERRIQVVRRQSKTGSYDYNGAGKEYIYTYFDVDNIFNLNGGAIGLSFQVFYW